MHASLRKQGQKGAGSGLTPSSVAALARSDCPAEKLSEFDAAAVSKRVCSGMKVCLPEAMAWVGEEGRGRLREESRVCCERCAVLELQ